MSGSSQRSKRWVTNQKTQRSNICGYGLDSAARTSDNGCGSGVDLRLVPFCNGDEADGSLYLVTIST